MSKRARLAAKLGHTAEAIRFYQHYLSLRSNPEAALVPERDRARAELARLNGERTHL